MPARSSKGSISRKTFEETPQYVRPQVLDQFVKNPNEAFSLKFLKNKFGDNVILELFILLYKQQIEVRFNSADDDYWYILKRKKTYRLPRGF